MVLGQDNPIACIKLAMLSENLNTALKWISIEGIVRPYKTIN